MQRKATLFHIAVGLVCVALAFGVYAENKPDEVGHDEILPMIKEAQQPHTTTTDPTQMVDTLRNSQETRLNQAELMTILTAINTPDPPPEVQQEQAALEAFCRRRIMVGDLFKNLGQTAQLQLIALTAAALSEAEEVNIGAQIHHRLVNTMADKLDNDPHTVRYLNLLLERLKPHLKRQDLQWQVHIIDSPDVLNAVSTSGGYIYFYTGLLNQIQNEAQVMGVLAHEVAHHELLHTRTIYQYLKALGLWADDTLADSAELDFLSLLTLPMRSYQEEEADIFAAEMLFRLGYSPLETVAMMVNMEQFDAEIEIQGSFGNFLLREALHLINTHPLSRLRACDLMAEVSMRKGWGEKVGAENWLNRQPMD